MLILVGCANQKTTFWCGDRECLNKKEKEAYFKKEMTVQIKDLSKSDIKEKSDIEKIADYIIGLENATNPFLLQLESPIEMQSKNEQIKILADLLREYL